MRCGQRLREHRHWRRAGSCEGRDRQAFYLRCAEVIEYPEDGRMLFRTIEAVIAALS
jgi:hypothetical protein